MFADFFTSFMLGLLTPLTAVCVLPLYPGFIAYLANKLSGHSDDRKVLALFGLLITLGVLLFMFLLGLVFTTLLQASLTKVVGIVSPIAFTILFVISVLLVFDVDIGRFFPQVHAPVTKNPVVSALLFGFFFGAIVIPCNPAFIAAMFTKSVVSGLGFLGNMVNFTLFGLGMGFPLILLSLLSATKSKVMIGFLTGHKRAINLITGLLMMGISLYYIIFVFGLYGLI